MEKTPTLNLTEQLVFQDWGLVPYQVAIQKQLDLVSEVADNNLPGYLIFCTHPPVVTTGRSTKEDDVFSWKGELIEVSRGGRATYHGPSQLIVYPIVNLNHTRHSRRSKEVVGFLRDFEEGIVKTLREYGIESQGRSLQKKSFSEADETGVWVNNKKIASLGIAVKKWVTYHGAAINYFKDPLAFQGINPCGFKSNVIVTVEDHTPILPSLDEFKNTLSQILLTDL